MLNTLEQKIKTNTWFKAAGTSITMCVSDTTFDLYATPSSDVASIETPDFDELVGLKLVVLVGEDLACPTIGDVTPGTYFYAKGVADKEITVLM